MQQYPHCLKAVRIIGVAALISANALGQVPTTRMYAVIHGGHSLKGDGYGPYEDGKQGSNVYGRVALSIVTWSHVDLMSNKPDPDVKAERERCMIFDLTRPVPDSGAKKVQTTFDYLARLHVFWRHDHETENIFAPEAIPVGTTVESERVEMWSMVDGIQHVLQMGPWAMGEFSPRSAINGAGTSKAKITRETEDSWRITAPNGSIARLWNYSDIQNPVDKGLYYFGFDVKFTKLK
jgi:hypothetical protein